MAVSGFAHAECGVVATDPASIRRQAQRARRAIARLDASLTPGALLASWANGDLKHIRVTRRGGRLAQLVYDPVTVDVARLESEVIRPLRLSSGPIAQAVPRAQRVSGRTDAERQLLKGASLLFAGDAVYAVTVESRSRRQVAEPSTERAVFGPKDALVEALDDNLGLIRSHLRDPRLQVERVSVGTDSPTQVAVLHVDGVADAAMVDRAMGRLATYAPRRMGVVGQLVPVLIGSVWSSLLPIEFTERPYRVADLLFRGRVAILADGSPLAVVTPIYFFEHFIDEEEYLQATFTRWFVRGLRAVAFFLALMAPGLYLAVLTVNTTILPGLLAVVVATTRQSLPFPIAIETFFMLIMLDVMAEATVSMKGVLGPAISIVGSLIIGSAAVRANLASNLGVILVAVTALATFATPRYHLTYAARVLKYPVMLVSSVFGLIGWTLAGIWLLAYLTSSRALGSPALQPLAPLMPGRVQSESTSAPHGGAPPRLGRPTRVGER